MPTVPTIVLKVYRAQERKPGEAWPELSDAGLLKVLALGCECGKPVSRGQALALLARAFPGLGRVWYVSRHPQGWVKCIRYQGEHAWVLVCHPSWRAPRVTAGPAPRTR